MPSPTQILKYFHVDDVLFKINNMLDSLIHRQFCMGDPQMNTKFIYAYLKTAKKINFNMCSDADIWNALLRNSSDATTYYRERQNSRASFHY